MRGCSTLGWKLRLGLPGKIVSSFAIPDVLEVALRLAVGEVLAVFLSRDSTLNEAYRQQAYYYGDC